LQNVGTSFSHSRKPRWGRSPLFASDTLQNHSSLDSRFRGKLIALMMLCACAGYFLAVAGSVTLIA